MYKYCFQEGNFPGAIQLCLQCQKAAQTYSQYVCISELYTKLTETLVLIENQLERALASIIINFDPDRYRQLLLAYSLLDKKKLVADKLLGFMSTSINQCAITVLLEAVDKSLHQATDIKSLNYGDLCKLISVERLIDSVRELLRGIWKILFCVHLILRYHTEVEEALTGHSVEHFNSTSTDLVDDDPAYIRKRLEMGLGRIWHDSMIKVVTLLQNTDLTGFKFDSYLEIVQMTNKFGEIGEQNFAGSSSNLTDLMDQHTATYFKNYHRARLDELRLFLESEAWTICPVHKSFSVLQLQEFDFLTGATDSNVILNITATEEEKSNSFSLMDSNSDCPFDRDNFFELYSNGQINDSADVSCPESEEDELLKQDYVQEGTEAAPRVTRQKSGPKSCDKMPPILCNTALNLMRLFGRYLHMMTMLKSVAFEAVTCLSQLFDYYLYSICHFFGSDPSDVGYGLHSSKLSTAIKRIESTLVAGRRATHIKDNRLPCCQLSPVVQLGYSDTLFGLAERTVGVESLTFVAKQLYALQSSLETILPIAKRPFLQQFFAQTVSVAPDVRRSVYGCIASRALNFQNLITNMAAANWDIGELMSQHNQYVDILVQDFQNLGVRMNQVSETMLLPREVCSTIWETAILCTNRVLIEGYASPCRKCSNEGRALMQLDFQQLVRKLETVTLMRPIPHKDLVENYIKAYYLPESAIEWWINDHKDTYTARQLITLLNVATHISKKTRQRLTMSLEVSIASST